MEYGMATSETNVYGLLYTLWIGPAYGGASGDKALSTRTKTFIEVSKWLIYTPKIAADVVNRNEAFAYFLRTATINSP